MDTSLLDTNLQSSMGNDPSQRLSDISQGMPSIPQSTAAIQNASGTGGIQDNLQNGAPAQDNLTPTATAPAPIQQDAPVAIQPTITQTQPMKSNYMLPVGGLVLGGLIGHFLIKKGHIWTAGIAVAGAALGYYFSQKSGSSNATGKCMPPNCKEIGGIRTYQK